MCKKTGIALLLIARSRLLKLDFEQIMKFFQTSFYTNISSESLISTIHAIKFTNR